MKATTLLVHHHRTVEAIFKKLEARKGDAAALVVELANDLCAHMAIEQTIFYPAVARVNESLVLESYEEHAIAELALKRLLVTSPDDITFAAKVTSLKELIQHHVGEEEDDLFPAVEKALDDDALKALGAQMKAAFEEAVEAGFAAALPKVFAKTTSDAQNQPAKKAHSRSLVDVSVETPRRRGGDHGAHVR